jgi:hypothetical protein
MSTKNHREYLKRRGAAEETEFRWESSKSRPFVFASQAKDSHESAKDWDNWSARRCR